MMSSTIIVIFTPFRFTSSSKTLSRGSTHQLFSQTQPLGSADEIVSLSTLSIVLLAHSPGSENNESAVFRVFLEGVSRITLGHERGLPATG